MGNPSGPPDIASRCDRDELQQRTTHGLEHEPCGQQVRKNQHIAIPARAPVSSSFQSQQSAGGHSEEGSRQKKPERHRNRWGLFKGELGVHGRRVNRQTGFKAAATDEKKRTGTVRPQARSDFPDTDFISSIRSILRGVLVAIALQYGIQGVRLAMQEEQELLSIRKFIQCSKRPFKRLWWLEFPTVDDVRGFLHGRTFSVRYAPEAGRKGFRPHLPKIDRTWGKGCFLLSCCAVA